jgi:hypothetical protein
MPKIGYLYSIFDSKVNSFAPPFVATNDQEAIRMFKTSINYGESTLNMYPEDFDLFRLGSFNSESGTFDSQLEKLCNCLSLKSAPEVK